ncbi:MAG: hypothetical protein DLD55_01840 [candidate division SR1 bacterium]|nr:MAG: hypothetical protein DLD55_01840 [candidate division SR1 bacterium]
MANNERCILLLGSGDTLGVPVVGCSCATCKTDKRKRFGLYIKYQGINILIDTSPDLKQAFLENHLDFNDIDYIFISHTHTDHINGLGELSYRKSIPVYYPNDPINTRNMQYFQYLENEGVLKKYPYAPYEKISLTPEIQVTPLPLNHGFPTCGFVIQLGETKVGIMSDTNSKLSTEVLEAFTGCDYLYLDAFSENWRQIEGLYQQIGEKRTKEEIQASWFHTTIDEIPEIQKHLQAKKLILVHLSHLVDLHQNLMIKYPNYYIGYDGMKIDL